MTREELQTYFIDACSVSDNVIRLGKKELNREDYLQIKKILEGRGGKWKGGSVNGFVFKSNATAIYNSLCAGDVEDRKINYQFFPTPDAVADLMVEKLWVKETSDVRVLEPSAGRGALIRAVRKECPDVHIDAYEINSDCYPELESFDNVTLYKTDFLDIPEEEIYDYIIANPPFANNADIRHFKKMVKMLKSGGRLCCIVSAHTFEGPEEEVRMFRVLLNTFWTEIQELPSGTFKESGTDVRSYLIILDKI